MSSLFSFRISRRLVSGLKSLSNGPGLLNFNELSNFSVHELSELVDSVRLTFAGICRENPERTGVSSAVETLVIASPTSANLVVFFSFCFCISTEDIPGFAFRFSGAQFSL